MEKRKLERALEMGGGYVLDFSNRTFDEFFNEVLGIEIYDSTYEYGSGSKANRMRAFWDVDSNQSVARVLEALLEDWEEYAGYNAKPPSNEISKIILRLRNSDSVPDISAIRPNAEEKGFETLAKAVREAIEKNEPETGLDRLHTFLVKYFRNLVLSYGETTNKDTPLHSLLGKYIKLIKAKGLIDSEITERILKSSISVLEALSKIRNDHSFAHDNSVLNYSESLLIFNHVCSSVRFIETLEKQKPKKPDTAFDDIPF